LLRGTQAFIVNQAPGTQVTREETEAFLDRRHPQRFTPASLKSFATERRGNMDSGRAALRSSPKAPFLPAKRPESLALMLFLAYLEGAPASVCSLLTGQI
jgi:hypothetical protein